MASTLLDRARQGGPTVSTVPRRDHPPARPPLGGMTRAFDLEPGNVVANVGIVADVHWFGSSVLVTFADGKRLHCAARDWFDTAPARPEL